MGDLSARILRAKREKKRQPRGDFSPLDCLFDLLLSSVSADNLYCSGYGRPGLSLPGNGLLSILSFQIKFYFLSWRHCPAGTPSDGLHILERGCVSVSLAFGASRGERLYFLLGRVRSACRHDVPFAKRPLLTKNLHRQVCPLDTLEFPVLRLPRRKRLREMDNLSDPLSACDLSTGNRALSFVHLPSFSLSASAI